MEIQIIRIETIFGNHNKTESNILCRYEIMDGAPINNEIIRIKMFLSAYDLTPSYPDINSKLQVNYYIMIILLDTENRRFYKKHEIELIRLQIK